MNYDIEKLIDVLKQQAKIFLEDADEFYPFGVAISKEGNIKPIGVYLENDHPQLEEVLAVLEKAINENIFNGEYQAVVIGLDVYLSSLNGKSSAVKVRIFKEGGEMEKLHIPYQKRNSEYVFDNAL